MTLRLDGHGLSVADVVRVARDGESVVLTDAALERMAASRAVVDRLAHGEPKYGISTGFGALASTHIEPEAAAQLQVRLVRSHAAGVGPDVAAELVRAMLLLRARTLAQGHSGVRPVMTNT